MNDDIFLNKQISNELTQEDYDPFKAKERACILWLLANSYNKIPDEVKEPYYKDFDNVEHLKPYIVHGLASVELYCLVLANLYADPNYHNLDHQSIIQVIIRKGIVIKKSKDVILTETVLRQITPLKINSHLAIIEALMSLYTKEIVSTEKIMSTIQRISTLSLSKTPIDTQASLILWINKCVEKLLEEINSNPENAIKKLLLSTRCAKSFSFIERKLQTLDVPNFIIAQDISDLADGRLLCAVVSLYCPSDLEWFNIKFQESLNLADAVQNLQLIQNFCQFCLPADIFHLSIEDLYFHFEIHPAKCVQMPDKRNRILQVFKWKKEISQQKSFPLQKIIPIPDLRNSLHNQDPQLSRLANNKSRDGKMDHFRNSGEGFLGYQKRNSINISHNAVTEDHLDYNRLNKKTDENFIVQEPKKSYTLNQLMQREQISKIQKNENDEVSVLFPKSGMHENMSQNIYTAGKPSTFDEEKKFTRRLRRNSLSEDSQLTIENFGGSQDNLFLFSKNPDKEQYYISGHSNISKRLSVQHDEMQNLDRKQLLANENALNSISDFHYNSIKQEHDWDLKKEQLVNPISFADLSLLKYSGINIKYMQKDADSKEKKLNKTEFISSPCITTWKQQNTFKNIGHAKQISKEILPSSDLYRIHQQLEERRKVIELDRKNAEKIRHSNQQRKISSTSFLKALNKELTESITPSKPKWSIPWTDRNRSPDLKKLNNEFEPKVIRKSESLKDFINIIKSDEVTEKATPAVITDEEHFFLHDNSVSRSPYQRKQWSNLKNTSQFKSPKSIHLFENKNMSNFSFHLHDESSCHKIDSNIKNSGMSPITNSLNDKNILHAKVQAPSESDMEPQNVSFIGENNDSFNLLENLQISSGSRTYRISNPELASSPRPLIDEDDNHLSLEHCFVQTEKLKDGIDTDKGFFISFSENPKHCKPNFKSKKQATLETIVPNKSEKAKESFQTSLAEMTFLGQEDKVSKDFSITNSPKFNNIGLIIDDSAISLDASKLDEMEKKKEKILLQSLKRKNLQENARRQKEEELFKKREEERLKDELKQKKKEEEKARREAILHQFKIKKAKEQAEKEGRSYDSVIDLSQKSRVSQGRLPSNVKLRPRPKTVHESSFPSKQIQNNKINSGLVSLHSSPDHPSMLPNNDKSFHQSFPNLLEAANESKIDPVKNFQLEENDLYPIICSTENINSKHDIFPVHVAKHYSVVKQNKNCNYMSPKRLHSSLTNLNESTLIDNKKGYSGKHHILGCVTPPNRVPSPSLLSSPFSLSPVPSFPHNIANHKRAFDTSSDAGSSSTYSEYCGPRLYKQPLAKSNRNIILNAVQHCIFPGTVNTDSKERVLEEINHSDSKHFLILFRDAKCQFRAVYSYNPDTEEIIKLFGTGPKQVTDKMFEIFFKYNSGGKCFTQVHTKHLSVTIDAFTIHSCLWLGKRVPVLSKKDLSLVI